MNYLQYRNVRRQRLDGWFIVLGSKCGNFRLRRMVPRFTIRYGRIPLHVRELAITIPAKPRGGPDLLKVVSFELSFALHAQTNGTLVAMCTGIPVFVAGHDADSLADKLISALRGVVGRVEGLGDSSKAQAYLAGQGIDSTVRTGRLAIGFDDELLRTELRMWAAEHLPSTLHCALAA